MILLWHDVVTMLLKRSHTFSIKWYSRKYLENFERKNEMVKSGTIVTLLGVRIRLTINVDWRSVATEVLWGWLSLIDPRLFKSVLVRHVYEWYSSAVYDQFDGAGSIRKSWRQSQQRRRVEMFSVASRRWIYGGKPNHSDNHFTPEKWEAVDGQLLSGLILL